MRPAIVIGALAATASCKSTPQDAPAPGATASPTTSPTASASAAEPAASAAVTPLPRPPRPTLDRSAVPSAKEWRDAQEVPLHGGAGLGCDAKIVREWVRVSCRGANRNGGTPTTVTPSKGGGSEVYTFAKNGITSLVLRFLPGTDFEATYGWSDDTSFPLKLAWPNAAPERPWPVGRFQGAPDEPVNAPERRAACFCSKLSMGILRPDEDVCADVPADAFAPECLRAHKPTLGDRESCNGLLECQWMAPSGLAQCLPGEVFTGVSPSSRCAVECGPGKPPCAKGTECTDNMGRGNQVCLEP